MGAGQPCGSRIPEDSKFCQHCGTAVIQTGETTNATNAEGAETLSGNDGGSYQGAAQAPEYANRPRPRGVDDVVETVSAGIARVDENFRGVRSPPGGPGQPNRGTNSVVLTQSQSGTVKQVKLGFSWTTLFFGLFVPLVRGDIKWAAIMFVLAFLSFGLSWLVFPFLYNKVHTRALLESGYAARTEEDRRRLQAAGLVLGET